MSLIVLIQVEPYI